MDVDLAYDPQCFPLPPDVHQHRSSPMTTSLDEGVGFDNDECYAFSSVDIRIAQFFLTKELTITILFLFFPSF